MSELTIDTADKLVELINAEDWTQDFTAARRWIPLMKVEDLNEAWAVSCIPAQDDRERKNRAGFQSEFQVDIPVQKHVADDFAAVDEVVDQAREILNWIEANAKKITVSGGQEITLLRVSHGPLVIPKMLHQHRIATSVVRVFYWWGA